MGLKMTLPSGLNHMACEFIDAYWSIMDLGYDTKSCYFRLRAYPSRDAKLLNLSPVVNEPKLPVGSPSRPVVDCVLYNWEASFPIADIFHEGIPLDANEQKTAIYNHIKAYTGLPFEDVFEEPQLTEIVE